MKARRVFIFSVLLNLGLAGWVAWRLGRTPGDTVTAKPGAAPAEYLRRGAAASWAGEGTTPSISQLTNRFHWRQIESNDYVQFATNLRAVGCPEKTVGELVSARARRALRRCGQDAEPTLPFWTAGTLRESTRKEAILRVLTLADNVLMEADDIAMSRSSQQLRQEIAAALSPAEFEEYIALPPLRGESPRDRLPGTYRAGYHHRRCEQLVCPACPGAGGRGDRAVLAIDHSAAGTG